MTGSAASGISLEGASALFAVMTAVTAFIGGVIAYLLRRRSASGRVATSDAGVLWQQAQNMRAELTAEKESLKGQLDTAVEQRERLIQSQGAQIAPALQEIGEALKVITELLLGNRDAGTDEQGRT